MVVHPASHWVPRALWYSGSLPAFHSFVYEGLTLFAAPSQMLPLKCPVCCRSATPRNRSLLVWALPVSLAATQGVSVDFFSSGYLDVSVRRVSLLTMLFLQIAGCPIRRYMVLCLLAASHVFSQLTASFVVAERQGIHRIPLLA